VRDGEKAFDIPRFSNLDVSNLGDLIGRISLIKPVEIAVRFGEDDTQGGVSMHFEGDRWRLSGVQLPPKVLDELAASLPKR